MWWHFVDQFYKPSQLATVNVHSNAVRKYQDVSPPLSSHSPEFEIYEQELARIEQLRSLLPINSASSCVTALSSAATASVTNPRSMEPQEAHLARLAREGKTAFGVWQSGQGFVACSENFEDITGIPGGMMMADQWMMALDSACQYQAHRMLEIACEEALPSQILVHTRAFDSVPSRALMMEIKPSDQERQTLVLFYDVTVQKQLEEALTRAEVSLKKANRGRSAFLSCMSHELRTPLNAIMGFSQMMREGVLGEIGHETYHEYVNHIHDSGAELLNKISTLLDIAALDSGGMMPQPRPSSLLEVMEDLRGMHTHAAFARKLTIALDVTEDIRLHCDPRMLSAAMSHVMQNCLRYARENSTIHLSMKRQKNDGVLIAIRDRGPGIDAEKLGLIREALAAEATYFQMNGDGIGLGLSMAKELMARQNGRLSIDAMKNQGTIVCLHIPEEAVLETPQVQSVKHTKLTPIQS